jgi:hypothetical protein
MRWEDVMIGGFLGCVLLLMTVAHVAGARAARKALGRRVVYVAHQLTSQDPAVMDQNRRRAAEWCVWLCQHFEVATVADWIVLSSVLEETPETRALGIDCDLTLIPRCDLLVLVGLRISDGMRQEIGVARAHGVPVIDLTVFGGAPVDYLATRVAAMLAPHGVRRALRPR